MSRQLTALVFDTGDVVGAGALGWGWMAVVASSRGLRMLDLPVPTYDGALQNLRRSYADARLDPSDSFLREAAQQVGQYLSGQRQQFSIDLDLRGHTTFELAVWAATGRIPYGETRAYGWIAAGLGGGLGAAQAVGSALGNNPVPLFVPCHRVVGVDGSLHGFAGGLDLKARLLALESGQLMLPLVFHEI